MLRLSVSRLSPPWRGGALRHGLLVLAALVLGLGAAAGAELAFPPLTGRVVDAAHVLDPSTLLRLDARLAAQEAKATDQVVVATVPSLQGTSVEDYANRLFRAWQIGQAKKNNGVLLLVAPSERKVRIEVGYGLEGILTDAVASTIIRNAIVPAFKAGDMAGGIVKGTDAILEILNLDPDEARARARKLEQPGMSEEEVDNIIFLIAMIAFWGFIIWRVTRGGGGPRGGSAAGRRGGALAGGPVTWDWGRGSGGWSGGSGGGGWSGGGGSSGGGGASGSW
ncbi:TPM domain-containing protein [Xanthobacter sp. AM33]